jgi:magnesium transporter
MITRYQLTNHGMQENEKEYHWIAATSPTKEEKKVLAEEFGVSVEQLEPQQLPEEVTHLTVVQSNRGEKVMLDTFIHYKEQANGEVEKGLFPVLFLLSEKKFLTVSTIDVKELMNFFPQKIEADDSPEYILLTYLLHLYGAYMKELKKQKKNIDHVYALAKDSMERKLLLELTDIERNLVYLEQTIIDQNETVKMLLEQERFKSLGQAQKGEEMYPVEQDTFSINETRKNKVTIRMETALKMVRLYRELVNSTSGLISDIMDNKLNNIMEQLQTISLVLTMPMMIFSLWGINTGGLIGRGQPWGSAAVVVLAILLGVGTWIYLKRKEF